MRARLLIVVGLVTAAWIAACGGSSGSSGDLVADDAGGDGSTTNGDGSSTDGSTPSSCDPIAVTSCGTRKCDPALGCVACVTDPDCTGANKFCIRGQCEACRTNTDCGVAAPVCAPGDHQCHLSCLGDAAARCQNNTPLCDPATGACVGCQGATDCPATAPLCEPTTKSCVQCASNTDCPATRPRCFLGDFTCVECIANADCGAGKACDPRVHRCTAVCTSDAQCTASPNTPKCNTATGACVQCLAGPDCAGTPTTPLCATPRDRCVQCISNTDCGDAGAPICDQDRCVECKIDKDCPGMNPKCNNGRCQ